MFENVQPPFFPLNAPAITLPAGRKRNRKMYAKNGMVTIHARLRCLRPNLTSGRSDAVARDRDLPARRGELLHVGEVQVVPVDRDRRLAGGDRLRRRLHRDEVPGALQLCEEVDAWTDIGQRAAVRERRREDAGDGRPGRERRAVERDLALVLALEQVLPRLGRGLDDVAVVADRHRAPVVAGPEATRVLHRARDRAEVAVEVLPEEALGGPGDREGGT